MKFIITLLGVALLIVAGVYFLLPADQLPAFLPGHEAGVTHVHAKHGIVAAIAGIVLIGTGWYLDRS
jgi:drug/metabolite transporter (DMT)-like permease